jgi:hypothetical protein
MNHHNLYSDIKIFQVDAGQGEDVDGPLISPRFQGPCHERDKIQIRSSVINIIADIVKYLADYKQKKFPNHGFFFNVPITIW